MQDLHFYHYLDRNCMNSFITINTCVGSRGVAYIWFTTHSPPPFPQPDPPLYMHRRKPRPKCTILSHAESVTMARDADVHRSL